MAQKHRVYQPLRQFTPQQQPGHRIRKQQHLLGISSLVLFSSVSWRCADNASAFKRHRFYQRSEAAPGQAPFSGERCVPYLSSKSISVRKEFISVIVFFRVQREPFETQFGRIDLTIKHQLGILGHSIQALQHNARW